MGNDAKSFLDLTLDDLKTGMPTEPPPGAAEKATATPDAKVIFENDLGVGAGDDVIDVPDRESFDELVAATGGPEMLKQNAEALREAVALTGSQYDELVEGLSPEEEKAEIVSTIKEWNEILGNPMKAQALLQKIYAHPMQEPGKSYFTGRGSPALNDAIAKLWQATTGEPIVGRKKSRGDGQTY